MVKSLYLYETPMYFSYIYYVIIMLLGVSQGEFSMLMFGKEIQSIKGCSTKWVFHLFLWVQMFWL